MCLLVPGFSKVTMDPHPHLGTLHASVHPCQHAHTMKKIVDALSGGDAAASADAHAAASAAKGGGGGGSASGQAEPPVVRTAM
jgi:ubiquitin-like-conjugating enzyme ATG3